MLTAMDLVRECGYLALAITMRGAQANCASEQRRDRLQPLPRSCTGAWSATSRNVNLTQNPARLKANNGWWKQCEESLHAVRFLVGMAPAREAASQPRRTA